MSTPALGVMLPRDIPIADLLPFARRAEELGFDELWVVEDCFYRGGIAQTAAVLAATTRITVGIGILPAAPRNVAFTALEVSTLAELHRDRVTVGLGHGVTSWMRQIGAWPASPLTLIEEQLDALRALLRGDEVTTDGRYVKLDAVRLENPPTVSVPILAGVRGPKSLAAAGRAADGIILAEPSAPAYVAAARARTGAGPDFRVVAYNYAVVDDDAVAAREAVRPALRWFWNEIDSPHLAALPYVDEIAALRAELGPDEFLAAFRDEWLDDLALVGSADRVRARLSDLADAGADSVVLVPVGQDPLAALESYADVLARR